MKAYVLAYDLRRYLLEQVTRKFIQLKDNKFLGMVRGMGYMRCCTTCLWMIICYRYQDNKKGQQVRSFLKDMAEADLIPISELYVQLSY